MALNGDAVTADANRKMNRAASKMLNIMVTAMEKGAGAAASKLQKPKRSARSTNCWTAMESRKSFRSTWTRAGRCSPCLFIRATTLISPSR